MTSHPNGLMVMMNGTQRDMTLCLLVVRTELRGRVPLGGGADEDAHGPGPRRGAPDGPGLLPADPPELRRDPVAQDLHAHLRERDLNNKKKEVEKEKAAFAMGLPVRNTLSCQMKEIKWQKKV